MSHSCNHTARPKPRIIAFLLPLLFLVSCGEDTPESGSSRKAADTAPRPTTVTVTEDSTESVNDPQDSCTLIAERMMVSSDVYRRLQKQRPRWLEPDKDSVYTFHLYEDFEDHMATMAWVHVDLRGGKVYEYDVALDTDKLVAFDTALVKLIPPACR